MEDLNDQTCIRCVALVLKLFLLVCSPQLMENVRSQLHLIGHLPYGKKIQHKLSKEEAKRNSIGSRIMPGGSRD